MGSGKGKARRVQAVASAKGAAEDVAYDEAKWIEFVENSAASDVLAFQYYLGLDENDGKSAGEYEKAVGELFADAVTVGAIKLPPAYIVTDFSFAIDSSVSKISLTEKPLLYEYLAFGGIHASMNSPMDSADTKRMVQDLARQVVKLLIKYRNCA